MLRSRCGTGRDRRSRACPRVAASDARQAGGGRGCVRHPVRAPFRGPTRPQGAGRALERSREPRDRRQRRRPDIATSLDRHAGLASGDDPEASTELLEALLDALRRGDSERLRELADMAVMRYGGIGSQADATERYFLYRVMRALELSRLMADALKAGPRGRRPGRTRSASLQRGAGGAHRGVQAPARGAGAGPHGRVARCRRCGPGDQPPGHRGHRLPGCVTSPTGPDARGDPTAGARPCDASGAAPSPPQPGPAGHPPDRAALARHAAACPSTPSSGDLVSHGPTCTCCVTCRAPWPSSPRSPSPSCRR